MSSDTNPNIVPINPVEQSSPQQLRLTEGGKVTINGCPFEIKEVNRRGLVLEPLRPVRYTVAVNTMQVQSWPVLVTTEDRQGHYVEIPPELIDRIDELEQDAEFHPRAAKLAHKRKQFIVIAVDEPYFKQAYELIREHELEIGRWSLEDETRYQEAVAENAAILAAAG